MQVCALSFGIGSLLVGAALKATPEAWLGKLTFNIDDQEKEEDTDSLLSRVLSKVGVGKVDKSDTDRLLESK